MSEVLLQGLWLGSSVAMLMKLVEGVGAFKIAKADASLRMEHVTCIRRIKSTSIGKLQSSYELHNKFTVESKSKYKAIIMSTYNPLSQP